MFLLGDEARLPSLHKCMDLALTENVELNVGGSTVAAAVREATGG